MINRLAKAQKSWVAKFILILTALSFMSLFGVSGYLSNAGSNRTVIRVDNIEISQAQFSYLIQKEINAAKNLLGENFELTEDMRSALIYGEAQKLVQDAIIDRTEDKYNMSFRPSLIQAIIVNEPTFRDASGNFNRDLFRLVLSESNLSEADFVANIKRDLARKILIDLPVKNINVPEVLRNAQAKVDNKRRTFKYIPIKPAEVKVDRKITEDEINQYYEDFGASFIEPERRDVSVLYLSMADIAAKMQISNEEIKTYYDEHKSEFETPETRKILQMMFEDEKEANKAFFALQNGEDFDAVAAEYAKQSPEDTNLGYVAEDELVFEISGDVFALTQGGYTKPINVGQMWQIMKVAEIKEGSKMPYAEAAAKIVAELKADRLYDESYEILTKIEDRLGAGEALEVIAQEFNVPLSVVKGVAEDGKALSAPQNLVDLINSNDFIDAAFSYNTGETSQVIETDNGLVAVRIDGIVDSHSKDLKDVRGEIMALWENNEKAAIVQELLNDIMHDVENGDNLSEAGKRYGLTVYKSQPITRNETFANIGYSDVREMFIEPLQTPRQIQLGEDYVVAVAENDYENSAPLSEAEQNIIRRNANQSLTRDFSEALLASYADEYKVRIKYRLMGLEY